MTRGLAFLIFIFSFSSSFSQNKQWKLVWADEFNYKGLPDSSKWDYDVGSHGWGNNEKQNYTRANTANARVNGSKLIIEARKEYTDSLPYSSARLVTRGKASWQYGKLLVRARLPKGLGSWPAIWMLADNMKQWPNDGEIDIMEHVGYDPAVVHASVHTKKYNHVISTQKTAKVTVKDFSKRFHVYAVEWNKDSLQVSVDGKVFFTFKNEHTGYGAWPFDNPMHLLLNIAVGGNWGAAKGLDDKTMPWKMEVDYVRVFQELF
ncbi:MAG: glycoside hydrolase family 16 protein [Ferruginibacter sp.]